MEKIELMAKKGIGYNVLNDENDKAWCRAVMESAKGSTGAFAKYFEPIVRHLVAINGLSSKKDFHARTNGSNYTTKEDGIIFINGKRLKYEIKTGDGIIGYIEPTTSPAWNETDILPDIDIVFYTCELDRIQCIDDVLDNTVALSRDEFLTFIATEGPKRKASVRTATKAGTNNKELREYNRTATEKMKDCIVLQSAYRKARQAACESGNYTSFRSFLQDNGRI